MDFERDTKTLLIGERITIKTFRGVKGNIIGRLPDGRTALFNRDSPYMSMLSTNQTVDCSVNHIAEKYIIVDPIREPKELEIEVPTIEVEPVDREERNEIEGDERFDNLRRLSDEGEWEISIFARALLHIIEMFDALKAKPPKSSSQKKDVVVDEPVEDSSDSDDFLQAADSFGLTQKRAREPESEFLRYLDEKQEKEKSEVEAPISIRNELFGTIADLPKNVRLLTVKQTRYLKSNHLKGLDGYDDIDRFTAFFVEASALERREYGNVFYASTGTNSWNKLHKVIVERF
ncbi:hypothetical protein ES703_33567 [subsurface metagenome]